MIGLTKMSHGAPGMSQDQMSAFRPPCYTFTEAYDRGASGRAQPNKKGGHCTWLFWK